jgi:acetyl esterase
MPLDPRAEAVLAQIAASGAPPFETLSPVEARAGFKSFFAAPETPEEVGSVEDRSIPAGATPMPVRIYRPKGEGPFPVLLYMHGGGWVVCDLDTHDVACRALCNEAKCIVVALDYRLAPEHKFPAAVDDCYAGLRWVSENARSFGGDPSRIAVGGDSAGGNLAAATALVARDSGGPKVGFQMLIYPAVDARMGSKSYQENAEGKLLTKSLMEWFWNHYLRNEADASDPRVSPLLEPNLAGLPPAWIITAEYDPLRDEGEAYAKRLEEAGVPVTLKRWNGLIHGFFTLPAAFPQAREAVCEAAAALRSALQ